MALDKVAGKLKEADHERRDLTNQIRDMDKEINVLRRSNDEAMRMQSIAVEERSKVSINYLTYIHCQYSETFSWPKNFADRLSFVCLTE